MNEYKKYMNELLDSEEMKFYLDNFGFKKNPTEEKIRSWNKNKLIEELELIKSKKSNLSKRERELVVYFASKIK